MIFLSAGCHELIAQGAKITSRAADILVEFGLQAAPQNTIETPTKPRKTSGQQAIFIPAQFAVPIDPMEAIILQACQNPSAVDEILEAGGLPLIP